MIGRVLRVLAPLLFIASSVPSWAGGPIQPPGPIPITCGGGNSVTAYGSYGSQLTCGTALNTGTINTGGPQVLAGYLLSGTAVSPLTLGAGLTLSGGQLSFDTSALVPTSRRIDTTSPLTGGGDQTVNRTHSIIANGITNSLLAQMPGHTFKGNNTGSAGNVLDLTATQLTAELNVLVGDSGAGGTKGLMPAPGVGDATKCASGAGTYIACAGAGAYNPAAVAITGGTITGATLSGNTIVAGNPVAATDPTPKSYVDSVAMGFQSPKNVTIGTAAVLPNTPTYNNGTAGVGATLTSTTNTALVVDGSTISVLTTRVLVKNQAAPEQNGIYALTQAGTGSVPWILTRATDFDQAVTGEIVPGAFVFVGTGATNAGFSFSMTALSPITVGTTPLPFSQIGATTAYLAGGGLKLTGNTFAIDNPLAGTYGGTGVNNGANTITIAGNLATVGAFATSLTMTAPTNLTLPTSGTLASSVAFPSCPDSGGNHLNTSNGIAFSCGTSSGSISTLAIGQGFTKTLGTQNAGPLTIGTDTLYPQFWGINQVGNKTVSAISDLFVTYWMNDSVQRTVTLPAASGSTGNVGSAGVGLCVGDKSGHGFTISSSTAFYGMPGVSGNSFTFSGGSFVCPGSDGTTWALQGQHGVIVDAQLPNTGVTAGTYVNPTLTLDAQGRIHAASNGAAAGVGPSGDTTGATDTPLIQAACSSSTPLGTLSGGTYYINATLVCSTLNGIAPPALAWYDYSGQITPLRIIGVNGSPWTNNAMMKCATSVGTGTGNNCGYSNFQLVPPPGVDGIDFGGAYGARFINVDIGGGAHVHRHGYVNNTGLTNEVYWYGGHLAGGTGCGIKDTGGLTDSSMIGMNISDYQDCGIELGPGSGLIGINSGRIEDQFSGPAIRLAASCLTKIGITGVSFDNNVGDLVVGNNCNGITFSSNVTSNEHAAASIEFVGASQGFKTSGNVWSNNSSAIYIMDDPTKFVVGSWEVPFYDGYPPFSNASTWQAMGPFVGSNYTRVFNFLETFSGIGWGMQRFSTLTSFLGDSTLTNNVGIDPFFGQQFAAGWRETATTATHFLGIAPLGFALENLTYTISTVVEPVGTNRFLAIQLTDNSFANIAKKYFDTTTCQPSGADVTVGSATVVLSGGNKINTGKCQVWAAMNLSVAESAPKLYFVLSTSNSPAGDSYLGSTGTGMNISYPALMKNIVPINGVPY